MGVDRKCLPWLGGFPFVVARLIVVLFGVEGLAEPRVALQDGVMTLAALPSLAAGCRSGTRSPAGRAARTISPVSRWHS